mmetsp:Transcript_11357/g.30376  ORF Transcript_11357/g.30376 Transcript_11357/m.30376 type:complete len:252 (+) Transcript_11357:1161-1916(+)
MLLHVVFLVGPVLVPVVEAVFEGPFLLHIAVVVIVIVLHVIVVVVVAVVSAVIFPMIAVVHVGAQEAGLSRIRRLLSRLRIQLQPLKAPLGEGITLPKLLLLEDPEVFVVRLLRCGRSRDRHRGIGRGDVGRHWAVHPLALDDNFALREGPRWLGNSCRLDDTEPRGLCLRHARGWRIGTGSAPFVVRLCVGDHELLVADLAIDQSGRGRGVLLKHRQPLGGVNRDLHVLCESRWDDRENALCNVALAQER